MSIKTLVCDLMARRSDTGTAHEAAMADLIFAKIKADPYFAKHSDHCGLFDGGDHLGRPVVWALKKGSGSRTVIFSGHYDTVGTSCYGELEAYCLDPNAVQKHLLQLPFADTELKRDLVSGDWMFGRGSADMKSGIALNLHVLFEYEPGDVNVLFTAVSDEENLSAGARQAVSLYTDLQTRFGLEYALCVISEPSERSVETDEPIQLIMGGAGKILPIVIAKGTPTHGSNMLYGINSAHLISRIVTSSEYDMSYVSSDKDRMTQPPTVQFLRDLKSGYDVSMPEFSAAALNVTFFMEADASHYLEKLKAAASQAIAEILEVRARTFDRFAAMSGTKRRPSALPDASVLTLAELESRMHHAPGFEAFKEKAQLTVSEKVKSGETLLSACIGYVRDLMSFSAIPAPFVVVAVAPPYYPAVHCDYLSKDINPLLDALIAQLAAKQGLRAHKVAYSPAMTDMSYTSCADLPAAKTIMDNMSAPASDYNMDVEAMARLNIPTVMIGPAQKDIHQIGERVYLPDVTESLPLLFCELIQLAGQPGM